MPGGALVVLSCCGAIRTELVATWEWCELYKKLQVLCGICGLLLTWIRVAILGHLGCGNARSGLGHIDIQAI